MPSCCEYSLSVVDLIVDFIFDSVETSIPYVHDAKRAPACYEYERFHMTVAARSKNIERSPVSQMMSRVQKTGAFDTDGINGVCLLSAVATCLSWKCLR